jgi:ABC-type sugar transport system permease subunit
MTAMAQPMTKPAQGANGWLTLLLIWHVLVAVAAAAGLFGSLTNQVTLPDWVRWFSMGALLLMALGSVGAVVFIPRRDHRGRALSLLVNYIGFLFSTVAFLQLIGAFTGLDELADRFPRSLPFLAITFGGYLIYAFADRYDNYPKRQATIQRVGKFIMVGGLLLALAALVGWESVPQFIQERLQPVILALLAGVVIFGLMCWAMWRRPCRSGHERQQCPAGDDRRLSFLSPNLIGFLLFLAGPLLLSLYTSFTNWDGFGTRDFIGLANYSKLLSLTFVQLADARQLANQVLDVRVYDELWRFSLFGSHYLIGAADKLFWIALRNTFLFGILVVPLAVIPALGLAAVLNSKLPGMKFYRSVYFIPSVAAVVGVALIWQWMYNATVGWINYFILITTNFVNSLTGLGLEAVQPRWLSTSDTALFAIVVMVAWQTIGFNTILFLAGMQNIPKVLYEAATVDGAGAWRQFTNITLPLLGPTMVFVLSTTIIAAFQIFEPIFIMTNPAGGPNNATLSAVLYLYQNGFQRFNQGYASAIAWLLFLIIFVVTLIQYRRQGNTSYEL